VTEIFHDFFVPRGNYWDSRYISVYAKLIDVRREQASALPVIFRKYLNEKQPDTVTQN
jgi:hypothetical protein